MSLLSRNMRCRRRLKGAKLGDLCGLDGLLRMSKETKSINIEYLTRGRKCPNFE